MIYIGGTNITNIYIGNTPIKKAYMGVQQIYSAEPDEPSIVVGGVSFETLTFEQTKSANQFALTIDADQNINDSILNKLICYLDNELVTFGQNIYGFVFNQPVVDSLNNKVIFSISTQQLQYRTFKVVYKDNQQELSDSIKVRRFFNYITYISTNQNTVSFYREYAGLNTYFNPSETVKLSITYRSETETKNDSIKIVSSSGIETSYDSTSKILTITPTVSYDQLGNKYVSIYSTANSDIYVHIDIRKEINDFLTLDIDNSIKLLTGKITRVPLQVTYPLGVNTGEGGLDISFLDEAEETASFEHVIIDNQDYIDIYIPYDYYDQGYISLQYQPTPYTDIWNYRTATFEIQPVTYIAVDLTNYLEQGYSYPLIKYMYVNSEGMKKFEHYRDNIYIVDYDEMNQAPNKMVSFYAETGRDPIKEVKYLGYKKDIYNIENGIYIYNVFFDQEETIDFTFLPYTYELLEDQNGCAVTGLAYSPYNFNEYLIPIMYYDKKINKIADNAFNYRQLGGVQCGSIEEIGTNAFANCGDLYCTFSSELKLIDTNAFLNTNVTSIIFYGTEEDWSRIEIREGNDSIKNASIVYKA